MRPYVIGGACHRVLEQLDTALREGTLALPPELSAHANRCAQCGPRVKEVEALFTRLRKLPAEMDVGPVLGVVDSVLQRVAVDGQPATGSTGESRGRPSQWRWLLGQVAAIAAVLCIGLGGITYLALKVNEAVGGANPSEMVERWVAPLSDWSQALFRNVK